MQSSITIGGQTIQPGNRVTLDLPLAPLYTHTQITMPLQVIHGKRPGPGLFVSAAIHGDEINGVEIIRRLLKLKYIRKIKGTLIAVPIVNIYGFLNRSRYLPDRRDLNRSFPGSKQGSLTGRLANLFMEEVVRHCSHGIDLHTGALHRTNLPQIRALLDNEETLRLARAFGAPLMVHSDIRDGSLRQLAQESGLVTLLYEGGEALRFDEVAIRAGVKGIVNVMRAIGMLKPAKTSKVDYEPALALTSQWVRASTSGLLRSMVPLGSRVEREQVLGNLSDPFGEKEAEIISPVKGIVIGRTNIPLANEGEALFHIAPFSKARPAQKALKTFHEDLNPEEGLGPSGEPPIV